MHFAAFWHALSFSALVLPLASADVRTYDFNVSWVNRNPDGLQERRVMGINDQWPIPTIFANVNDTVVVNLYNGLDDVSTTLHFHGLFQNGTTQMDGPGQVSQCPIPPGSSFTYNFTIQQPGTYWYHAHLDSQYPDGLRGPLIIHDPQNPFADQFDEELVLTLTDWYHGETPDLLKSFMSVTNPTGAEPIPDSALMNDTQNLHIPVAPGKTYYLRIISVAAFAPQYFWIEGHTMRVIEVDGVYHDPAETSQIYIAPAQRYGVLVTTKNDTTANFPIVGSMDTDLFDTIPDTLNPNVTSWLVYDETKSMPEPAKLTEFDPFDDMILVPYDKEELFRDPVQTITLDVVMQDLGNGENYAFFNNITYISPKVPTLYTALSAGELATNAAVYGEDTHVFVLGHNEVYEMVVNNHDTGKHPFHLHGHQFQSLVRSDENAGDWDIEALRNGSVTFPTTPMRRDTLIVRPEGHFVIRFRSDNPGVWIFHCHIEWHVASGLIMTIVEAPLEMQKTITLPEDHLAACAAGSPAVPTIGNAAANTEDYLDLTGQNLSPAPLPAGFTARGIIALVFSCVAGVLGISVIAWYGMGEFGAQELQNEKTAIETTARNAGVDSPSDAASVDADQGGRGQVVEVTSGAGRQ